jgi:hypothetical protein
MEQHDGFPPIALVDEVSETHRDIKGYYTRFGFLDNSTLERFLGRVILPSLRVSSVQLPSKAAAKMGDK